MSRHEVKLTEDYKVRVNALLADAKKQIPTAFSEPAVSKALHILESTPAALKELSSYISEKDFAKPITKGKRSFKETLHHFLNIEALNYVTIYPALLIDKPRVYGLHAERDLGKLRLYEGFTRAELLTSFQLERRKTLNFLKSLEKDDWQRQIVESGKSRQETIYWRTRALALHDHTHLLILRFQMEL